MSIIDNLVYDRTQADVDRVFTLKNKILTEGLSSLSAEEKTEYMAGMKGAYNYGAGDPAYSGTRRQDRPHGGRFRLCWSV